MTKKKLRRIWWFEPSQIDEAEAWLSQLIHTDPQEHAYTLFPLRRYYLWLLLAAAFVLALLSAPYLLATGDLLVGVILNADIFSFLLFGVMLGFMALVLVRVALTSKLIGSLRKGEPLSHTKAYTSTLLLKPSLIALSLAVLLVSGIRFGKVIAAQNYFLPLPPGSLPVVRIAEVAGDAQVYPVPEGGAHNWYRTSSSLLAPRQWYANELAVVQTGRESYTTSMISFLYEAKSPWLARKLGAALTESRQYKPRNYKSNLVPVESPFEAMWMYHNINLYEIVAVQGKYVYHLYYNGRQPVEAVIQQMQEKIYALERLLPATGSEANLRIFTLA